MNPSIERFSFGRGLTIATLVALAVGILAGTWAPESPAGAGGFFVGFVEALGAAWVRALRMVIVPLVVSLLVVAVMGAHQRGDVARMGGAAVGIFIAIYLALAVLSALLFPPLVRLTGIARGAMASLRLEAGSEPPIEAPARLDVGEWLLHVVPTNPLAAAAEENLLQVVVFTILFALAASRLAPEARGSILAFFGPVGDAMLVIVSWLLRVSPIAVFALGFSAAREMGVGAAWVLLSFAIVTTAVLLVAIVGLVPVAGVLGRVGTLRFARAAWPGQLVALATRSSLASLPALIESAKSRLGLPDRVLGFGLPLAASTFKPNRLVSSPGKLLFLSWIYGIPVDPLGYAMFVGYVMLIATTSVGIPNQGTRMSTLPAYLALGMPVEGVVLLNSVDMLWDFAATALNATGYLAATSLLPREDAEDPAGEPVASPQPLPVGP